MPVAKVASATKQVPVLPVSELEDFKRGVIDDKLIAQLQTAFCLKLSAFDRARIDSILATYASSAFDPPSNRRIAIKSEQAVARALAQLLNVIDKQRGYPVPDPRREGYEYFVLYSQRAYSAAEARDCDEALLTSLIPEDPGLCRDVFDQHIDDRGHFDHSLGDRRGWLEALLRDIFSQLNGVETKRGPKGKHKYRTFVIYELAQIFTRSGGAVKAYKNSSTGEVDGPFVDFVRLITDACPPVLGTYLGTGMDDAIVKWVQAGRKPPSDGLMSFPLNVPE